MNVKVRGKIPHNEWPKIAERFQHGETLTEIARSYHCTAPAIRYIVNRVSTRPMRGRMERDKLEKIAVLAPSDERRRSALRGGAMERANPVAAGAGAVFRRKRRRATSGAASTTTSRRSWPRSKLPLSTDDSDQNYEALLLATDRLLWASARTRLELERVLGNRKKEIAVRRASG